MASRGAQLALQIRRSRRTGDHHWRSEIVYAITELTVAQRTAAELADALRSHWGIENRLHWVRDVTFTEDLSRSGPAMAQRSWRCCGTCRSACTGGPAPATSPRPAAPSVDILVPHFPDHVTDRSTWPRPWVPAWCGGHGSRSFWTRSDARRSVVCGVRGLLRIFPTNFELVRAGGCPYDPDVQAARQTDDALLALSRLTFYGGLFATSLLSLRTSTGLAAGDILIIASLGLALIYSARPTGGATRDRLAVLVLVLVLVGGSLATYRADSISGSLAVLLRLMFLIVVLPWQMRLVLANERQLARAAYSWAAGAALCGFGTVLQYTLGAAIIPGSAVTNAGRYAGFAQHVSDTGGITATAAAFLIAGLAARSASRRNLLIVGILLAAVIIGLLLSGSVSGLLALTIATILMILRGGVSARRVLVAGCLAIISYRVASIVQGETANALSPKQRILQVTGLQARDQASNTTASRLDTIRAGVDGFFTSPLLGRGLDIDSTAVIGDLGVHNIVVAAAYNGGLLLALGLVLALGRAIIPAVRRSPDEWPILTQLNAAVIAATVIALTAPSLINRYLWVPLVLQQTALAIIARATPQADEVDPHAAQAAGMSPATSPSRS